METINTKINRNNLSKAEKTIADLKQLVKLAERKDWFVAFKFTADEYKIIKAINEINIYYKLTGEQSIVIYDSYDESLLIGVSFFDDINAPYYTRTIKFCMLNNLNTVLSKTDNSVINNILLKDNLISLFYDLSFINLEYGLKELYELKAQLSELSLFNETKINVYVNNELLSLVDVPKYQQIIANKFLNQKFVYDLKPSY